MGSVDMGPRNLPSKLGPMLDWHGTFVTVIWYLPVIWDPRYQMTSDLVPTGTKSLGIMQTC